MVYIFVCLLSYSYYVFMKSAWIAGLPFREKAITVKGQYAKYKTYEEINENNRKMP